MITNKMISDSLRTARDLAPKDTRNLELNAIKVTNRTSRGFTIKYSGADAYYIQFVEEGTSKQEAQHFIERTYLALVHYFNSIEQGNGRANSNTNKSSKQEIDRELYNDNPDYRRLVHRQSIFQHYQNENRFNEDGTQQLYRGRGE